MAQEPIKWLSIIQSFARSTALLFGSLYALTRFLVSRDLKSISSTCSSLALVVFWLASGVLLFAFLFQNLSKDTVITIDPISVPRTLSDNGYTPEVASHRLRDALVSFAAKAGTAMRGPDIALRDDLPDIVIPKVDFPIESVLTSLRNIFHYGVRHTISGEIIISDKRAWLRLRVDGRDVYSSPSGSDVETPDALFAAAASPIIETFQPYIVASELYHSDPRRALEKADAIINSTLPPDANAEWSYVLKSRFYNDHKNYGSGKDAAQKALAINDNNAVAHNNLGFALLAQGNVDHAVVELRRAISLDPRYALPHVNLGLALSKKGLSDEAISEYRRASQLDPNTALAHNNLGFALKEQGKIDEAVIEYRRAISLDPKFSFPHNNLGSALKDQGKLDEAADEFRRAIELDKEAALPHRNLGVVLSEKGRTDEAITEFRRALELDPSDNVARANLNGIQSEKSEVH
jgi:Tfp pilus assembly protein PilF